MFGLGFWEIAIILAIALIVLGPSKLPELAKGLGKGLKEFRKATEDFKSTIEDEMNRPDPLPPPKAKANEQLVEVIPAQGAVPHDPHAHPPLAVEGEKKADNPAAPPSENAGTPPKA